MTANAFDECIAKLSVNERVQQYRPCIYQAQIASEHQSYQRGDQCKFHVVAENAEEMLQGFLGDIAFKLTKVPRILRLWPRRILER